MTKRKPCGHTYTCSNDYTLGTPPCATVEVMHRLTVFAAESVPNTSEKS